jgi:hypothetical protein
VCDEKKIAARTVVRSGRALTGEPDALAFAHALGDRDVEAFRLHHATHAAALRAHAVAFDARTAAARAEIVDLQRDVLRAAGIRFGQR